MSEPIDKGFSILKKQVTIEPSITYTLPDGSTTIWLNEYVDGMVQVEHDRIIKLLETNLDDDVETDALHYQNAGIQIAINLIKGENK